MSSKKPKIAARETPDATDATEALDNLRREKFCRYYAQGEGTFGNATLSYAAAYDIELGDLSIVDKEGRPVVEKDFRGQYEVCATNGWRLLKNADVQARITVLLNALLKDEIVDAELAKVIKQDGDLTPKVAAIKEFNKLRGRIIEMGAAGQVYDAPAHPYTQMLLDAVPVPDPALQRERLRRAQPERHFPDDETARGPCAFGEDHALSGTSRWHRVTAEHGVSCRFWPENSPLPAHDRAMET